jgi:ABC-type Fe3+/spermidine/putrescine transport system ATPase subunit/nucleotide-binding universal stress UspA family protein
MSIQLEGLYKQYGDLTVVEDVTLEINEGELFVLLGASGSGKTTVLRMIAGLVRPDAGRIILHGRDVTDLPPQGRGTGVVFQNYSVFRHMTVAENVQFGLKIRKVSAVQRQQRSDELLEMVGMTGLADRLPEQLSGGQRQRVALARALAYEPSVLLLDEPFGALDVKIRAQLRRSLKEIQQRMRITTVLVTHDQEEAFELGDRIGVIERARLLEVGAPEELYTRPRTLSVAGFLGAGSVLVGRAEGGVARLGPLTLPIPSGMAHEEGSRVLVLIRPEQVAVSANKHAPDALLLGTGSVVEHAYGGAFRRVRLRVPRLPGVRQVAPPIAFGEEGMLVDALVPRHQRLEDTELWVGILGWHILEPSRPRLLVVDTAHEPLGPLELAGQLVAKLDAEATLLGVTGDARGVEDMSQLLSERREQAGLKADVRVRVGDLAAQVAAEQTDELFELVVLAGSRAVGALAKGGGARRLDELTFRMLAQTQAPVLVVKGEPTLPRRLLICTASGEPGKQAILTGGRLARRLGADVTLLHVQVERAHPGVLPSRRRRLSAPRLVSRIHLERGAASLRALDVECTVRTRTAAWAADGILAEAREGSHDLVVMGRHPSQARALFDTEDVTHGVLDAIGCSALVVPTEGA